MAGSKLLEPLVEVDAALLELVSRGNCNPVNSKVVLHESVLLEKSTVTKYTAMVVIRCTGVSEYEPDTMDAPLLSCATVEDIWSLSSDRGAVKASVTGLPGSCVEMSEI